MGSREAYFWALAISVSLGLNTVFLQINNFQFRRISMQMKAACCSLVYRKALRLSNKALDETTTGHIVNIISNDINKLDHLFRFVHYLWASPLIFAFIFVLIWKIHGPSCLPAFGFVFVMVLGQGFMGKILSRLRAKSVVLTDERVRLMSEAIAAMRVVKMYAWEESFAERVRKIRQKEIQVIQTTSTVFSQFMGNLHCFIPTFMFILFVFSTVVGDNTLDVKIVFLVLPLVSSMRLAIMLYLPHAITKLARVSVLIKRLKNFLLLDEIESVWQNSHISKKQNSVACFECVTGSWNEVIEQPTLKDISFHVMPGELMIVNGPVGSGKSSLLMALLNELPIYQGNLTVKGTIAYVSQLPWVFSASLRQNMLFGRSYDKTKYEEVLDICALQKDIQDLPHGDYTLVGERGVALSGGQRARVSLARALYSDADIYLLDDPLSAVDAGVGRHIFNKGIKSYLSSKICILVTHQLQYVKDADRILNLKEGKMMGIGSEIEPSRLNDEDLLKESRQSTTKQTIGNDTCTIELQVLTEVEPLSKRTSSLSSGSSNSMTSDSAAWKLSDGGTGEGVVGIQRIEEEDRSVGIVDYKIYKEYFKAGGMLLLMFSLIIAMIAQTVIILTDWWLVVWAQAEGERQTLEMMYGRLNSSALNQDPVLFRGSLRKNLDMFSEYTDDELWKSLEQVQLRNAVEIMGGLDGELSESGSNLSAGQRQLVCLARAILRNNKILIIDEATANVDKTTDAIIQQTIRTRFQHCTLLTIAHRLNTVMDSDRILVMSDGRIAEFDEPHLLLQNPSGYLSQMVAQTGRAEKHKLCDIAEKAYKDKHCVHRLWITNAKRSLIRNTTELLQIETTL
ncbi:ATP-binding cassette sub-family C member 4-like [Saccoglossus kowalevskii]